MSYTHVNKYVHSDHYIIEGIILHLSEFYNSETFLGSIVLADRPRVDFSISQLGDKKAKKAVQNSFLYQH